jgi:hypothetical protein
MGHSSIMVARTTSPLLKNCLGATCSILVPHKWQPNVGGEVSIVYVKEMIKMNETRRNGPELPEGKLNRPHLQVGGDVETWDERERERWRDWAHLYKSHLLYTLNGEICNCFWVHHWCWKKPIFIERGAKLVENENLSKILFSEVELWKNNQTKEK